MSILLKALLGGADFKEALAANGKAIRKVAARKTTRSFKVTRHNGFISTEIYPELSEDAEDAPLPVRVAAGA
jgi:hypothetical protein